MSYRMLIAGTGNIFLGDDGFGVEVINRLAREALPSWVRVEDFGIRGVHLAYEMTDPQCETTVLIDAMPRGEAPGTVYLVKPEIAESSRSCAPDAHSMDPQAVLAASIALGGIPGRVFIVGCEPASIREHMGLSEPVARAVDEAVRLVHDLVAKEEAQHVPGNSRTNREVAS